MVLYGIGKLLAPECQFLAPTAMYWGSQGHFREF